MNRQMLIGVVMVILVLIVVGLIGDLLPIPK